MRSSVTGDYKGPLHPSQRPSPLQSHPSPGYGVQGSSYVPPVQHPGDARFQVQAGTRPPARRTVPRIASYSASHAPTGHQSQQSQGRVRLAPIEGWLAMALLTIAVYSVVFSIISVNQVNHSFILLWSTAIGLLVGLMVAKLSRLPQVILHLAACLLGHWLSVFFTSVAFHTSWLVLLGDLRTVFTGGFANALTPDSDMVFLFYLSFLSFFLGYFGAWLTYRAHLPWLVGLVYCAILLINLNYAKQDQSLLIVVLLTSLILLVARVQLTRQLAGWISEGLHTDRRWLQNITSRFMRISSVLVLIALLLSLMLPVSNQPAAGIGFWNGLNNLWTNITHGQLSLQDPGGLLQPYQSAANFFGDQLSITGNVNLPGGEVLYYTTNATNPQYLEGFTYDHFDGHTWTSNVSGASHNYGANVILPSDLSGDAINQATTTVTIEQPPEGPKHYIFAPYEPTSFSVNTTLYGTGFVSAWTQSNPLTSDEQYQVVSTIPLVTAQDLSTVPLPTNSLSTWLNDSNYGTLQGYYLQTPNDLSSNVLSTAQQWTRGATNAYATVKMLQDHFNDGTQFVYSVTNPPVPANVDAVDWLLKTHQGYCTYYATAMTIMARLLGIPARVANGFSQGHYDAQRKVWVVDGSDAHSWVQVYFPGYGWINFDPTPGYALNGPAQPQPAPPTVPTQPPARPTPTTSTKPTNPAHPTTPGSASGTNGNPLDGTTRRYLLLDLSLVLLFCLILAVSIGLFRYWRRKLTTRSSFVSKMYWRVCRLASWAGLAPQGWQTPYEYSRGLARHFPQDTAPLRRLTELYVRERWAAPHEMPYPAEEDDLERLWPHLRRVLLRLFLLRFGRGKTNTK